MANFRKMMALVLTLAMIVSTVAIYQPVKADAASNIEYGSYALKADDMANGDITATYHAVSVSGCAISVTATASNKVTVDGNPKTLKTPEGTTVSATKRIKLGGTGKEDYRSIHVAVDDAATITFYALSSSSSESRTVNVKKVGSEAVIASFTIPGSESPISGRSFTVTEPGDYYIASASGGLNIYMVTAEVYKLRTLESKSLAAFAQSAKADGDTEAAGTDNYFELIYSSKSKVDSSTKTWSDEYTSNQRINFGGSASKSKNAIKFTTTLSQAKVQIWWACGGNDRQMTILNSAGVAVATTVGTTVANTAYLSELVLEDAGTYYLGGDTGSNYIFKVVVTEINKVVPPRADWSGVAAPSVTSASVDETNSGNIIVTASGNVSRDGGDVLTVKMYAAADTEFANALATKTSSAQNTTHTLTFTPAASGDYVFTATLSRAEETDKAGTATAACNGFILPLAAPTVAIDENLGSCSVSIKWNETKEADSYKIFVDGAEVNESTDICCVVDNEARTAVISGLTDGTVYTFGAKAVRGEEISAMGGTVDFTATAEVVKTWSTVAYGESTNTANNGSKNITDTSVTVFSNGGKGKIQPGSTDGLAFYYTTIAPETENFTLEATVTVDEWTWNNGQEGFGLMVSDTIGTNGDSSKVWNNSIMGLASKIEYNYDPASGEVTTDTSTPKITMKQGIGALVRTGVTAADIATYKSTGLFAGGASVPAGFTTNTYTLETSCAPLGAGTYNIIGNATSAVAGTQADKLVTSFKMSITRNNTGYIVRYMDLAGNVIGERMIVDLERTLLTQIEADKIYVGFFASRYATATFSDISLTLIDPADDAPAEVPETEYIAPSYVIESAAIANTADYQLVYYGNADGVLNITDYAGNVIAEDVAVTASTKARFNVTLNRGINAFIVKFTPNADYVPGRYQELSSYEPAEWIHRVDFRTLSGEYIYVAPDGKSGSSGTSNNPVDIYTAVKYAAPGQTIVLAGGTYYLSSTVNIERGISGTAEAPIKMVADSYATSRPVFNSGGRCAGMILSGDYWIFSGFDVTNSADGQKGIQLSGSHCVLSDLRTYRNGNTGIQISRAKGSDLFEDWPSYNTILNCTSYLNADSGYEDADGFAAKLTVGEGNVFDGCISAFNADDGWDLYAKAQTGSIGRVTIQNSLAFMNGYVLDSNYNLVNAGNGNGFKMGGESLSGYHTLINSVAFNNKAKGFDSNSCPDIQVYNSTSFNNNSYNVAFYTNNAVNTDFLADGIISYKTIETAQAEEQLKLKGTQVASKVNAANNYYTSGVKLSGNGVGTAVSDDWFVSMDADAVIDAFKAFIRSGVMNADGISRNADGTINMNGFLELTAAAPADAGARMTGTANVVVATPDTSKIHYIPITFPEIVSPDADSETASGDAAGSESTEDAAGAESTDAVEDTTGSENVDDAAEDTTGADNTGDVAGADGTEDSADNAEETPAVGANDGIVAEDGKLEFVGEKSGKILKFSYAYNTDITELVIDGGITYVGRSAFSKNTSLTKAELEGEIKTIAKFAFWRCSSLEELTLGENIESIGYKAFKGCANMKSLVIKTDKLTADNIGFQAFKGLGTDVVVTVPAGKLEEYTKLLRAHGLSKKVKIVEAE